MEIRSYNRRCCRYWCFQFLMSSTRRFRLHLRWRCYWSAVVTLYGGYGFFVYKRNMDPLSIKETRGLESISSSFDDSFVLDSSKPSLCLLFILTGFWIFSCIVSVHDELMFLIIKKREKKNYVWMLPKVGKGWIAYPENFEVSARSMILLFLSRSGVLRYPDTGYLSKNCNIWRIFGSGFKTLK